MKSLLCVLFMLLTYTCFNNRLLPSGYTNITQQIDHNVTQMTSLPHINYKRPHTNQRAAITVFILMLSFQFINNNFINFDCFGGGIGY